MKQYAKLLAVGALAGLIGAGAVAWAAQTNYLGTVFIADTTTPTQQLKVNADGSINITSGAGGSTTNAPVAPASPTATNSNLVGCEYVAAGVTFTNLQQGSVQCDSTGHVITNTTVTAYDSGAVTQTATPANSSHAAGVSVGGLLSVALVRTSGGSGIITNLGWKSTGGSIGQLVVRIWQKNPASTTCTDNVAFAGNDTDDANLIIPPFTITPAAPAVTTGDTATYATVTGVAWDYKNADSSPGQNLYVCAVTVATDTADDNHLVRVTLSGPQN